MENILDTGGRMEVKREVAEREFVITVNVF